MPRLVARSRTGDVVAEDTVDVERVVEVLCRWIKVLSRDAVISIDEVPLTEADKERLRRSVASPAPAPVELQHIRSYFDVMHIVFENVRQAEWESLRRVQSFSREMADDMVRQRDLMHRCLKDVDAVDRSITATGATNQIQGGMRAIAEHERGGMTVEDLLHGVSKFLRGLKG
jgi:hypothetical protein